MTKPRSSDHSDVASSTRTIDLLDLVAVFAGWRRILLSMVVLVAAAYTLPSLSRDLTYTAELTFVPPPSASPSSGGLSAIAGQFGVNLRSEGQMFSPDFYAELVRAPGVLERLSRGRYRVESRGTDSVPFIDLFAIEGPNREYRVALGARRIRQDLVTVNVSRSTGIVTVSITTKWPEVSEQLSARLLGALDESTRAAMRAHSVKEVEFVQARLAIAEDTLAASESILMAFLEANRSFEKSAELQFEYDRLQREVARRQGLVNSLHQSLEEVRLRAVRDTPMMTVIDGPVRPVLPNGRGRIRRAVVGLILGTGVGVIVVLVLSGLATRLNEGDPRVTTVVERHPRMGRILALGPPLQGSGE